VLVDGDHIYLYWGSWNVARVVELNSDMTSLKGNITTMSGLTGFFEAPWVTKKDGLYHMLYDWKQGGSQCTPSNYQACIGYAISSSPTGPWTYQGIVLGGTSATTVHPSLIEHNDNWYLTYHTKDAQNGGHFRRSVAIDEITWADGKLQPTQPTRADDPAWRLTRNVAPDAQASASFTETPPMRVGALNDGRAETALLPPDQWGNYRGNDSKNASDWVMYQWDSSVRVSSMGIKFHRDGGWIRQPARWELQYRNAAGDWQELSTDSMPTAVDTWHTVSFPAVTTDALRLKVYGAPNGAAFHSVAISEWEVNSVDIASTDEVVVYVPVGEHPDLPQTVLAHYADNTSSRTLVRWQEIPADEYANAGETTVRGRVLGQTNGYIQARVIVGNEAPPQPADTEKPEVSIALTGSDGTDGWYSSEVTARVRATDNLDEKLRITAQTDSQTWESDGSARYLDVQLTDEGITSLTATAQDGSGNTGTAQRTVKIDTSAPTVDAELANRTVTITADDALSGIATISGAFDGGEYFAVEPGVAIAAPDGLPHRFDYLVVDKAGNSVGGKVDIPRDEGTALTGNVAPFATASASFTSSWEAVTGLNDGMLEPLEQDAAKLGLRWATWPQVGQQTAQLDWDFDVTVDKTGVWWFRDSADSANAGVIPARRWALQYLDDGVWRDVTVTAGEYGRSSDAFEEVSFEPVTTRSLRIVAQAWGENEGEGSLGIHEWQVLAAGESEVPDTTAPVVSVSVSPKVAESGWFTSANVTVAATATDDVTAAPTLEYQLDDGGWVGFEDSFAITGEGLHSFVVRATDEAGNSASTDARRIKIDSIAPVSSAVVDEKARTVTLRGTDNGSGIARIQYATTGNWTTYDSAFKVGQGKTQVRYRAVDNAGNVEQERVITVPKAAVAPAKTTLTASGPSKAQAGQKVAVKVSVTAAKGKPTGTVELRDGKVSLGSAVLSQGKATITTTKLGVGTRKLTVSYRGDKTYADSSDSLTVAVSKASASVKVTAKASQRITDATATVAVTVPKESSSMQVNGQITATVGKRTVARATVRNGKAKIDLGSLAVGKQNLTFTFAGNEAVEKASASKTITITKAKPTVKAKVLSKKVTPKTKAKVQVTVQVKGVTVSGKVKVTSGKKTLVKSAKLSRSGKVTVNLPKLKKGTHKVKVTFLGNSKIASGSKTVTITVK
jgi:hypothetical protein